MEHQEDSKKRKIKEESDLHDAPMEGYEAPVPLRLSRDDLKRLLEPLSKEQLVALLTDAGSQYSAVADDIREVASKDPAHRKLFVRGLAWETTSQDLRDAFEQFGEIEEGAVIIDKATGKSRGFGFITFKHMDSAQRALKEPSKTIDGRITVCNLASVGTSGSGGTNDQAQRKLYIGGLSYETSNETLLNIFSKYGEIEEGAVAYDKNTNKSRGFAFVTYKTVEAARNAIDDPNKTIEGRHVIVKLAAEGQKEKAPQVSAPSQGPQAQPGYNVVNPNIPAYARPPPPGTILGFSPHTAVPAYSAAYAGIATMASQYTPQYAGAQYGIPAPQPGQNGTGGYYAPN
ncbi:hypothetical protein SELMODRAFT_151090 [Selaginella moellendorffii]|uniref:RRM domain-containing protein n=1 Tax=Selaginella moellendorffii TaxID=88036 RepID=D8RYI0_SELML|nr:UBP1-associated protein 2C [Selaginella moellendorffii]EFJ23104.1 hypothetical protein SELMODRAFT_151090 [Selaginella moellendorffii]|eukprot:XP_002976199.1 UBP1-associated protein 2C [Selaginella moellendorffii]